MSISAEKKGLVATQRKMVQVAKDLSKDGNLVVRGVAKGTLIVVRGAKKKAPVDRGLLRNSITPQVIVRDNVIRGVVGSNREYAEAMEMGTKPHHVPLDDLLNWAKRKLKVRKSKAYGMALAVQKSIAKRGTKARKFLEGAFSDNADKIRRIIERAINKAVEK